MSRTLLTCPSCGEVALPTITVPHDLWHNCPNCGERTPRAELTPLNLRALLRGVGPTLVSPADLGPGTDHGSLSGLGDDDHLQYLLLAGRTSQTSFMVPGDTTKKMAFSDDPLVTIEDTNTYVLGGGSTLVLKVQGRHSGGAGSTGRFFQVNNANGAGTQLLACSGGGTDYSVVMGPDTANAGLQVVANNFNVSDLVTITSYRADARVLVIRGTTSQSAVLTEWRNITPAVVASVSSAGVGMFAGLSIASVIFGRVASSDLTGQTAAFADTTLYTTVAAGLFRIAAYAVFTAVSAPGTLTVDATWTDPQQTTTDQTFITKAFAAAGDHGSGGLEMYCTAASTIKWRTTFSGTGTYSLYGRVEAL